MQNKILVVQCYYGNKKMLDLYELIYVNRMYIKNTLLCLLKFIRSVFHGFEFFTAHPAKKISYTFHIIPRLLLFYHGAINHV